MAKIKRRLTHDEEFQVMKLVLDKFLWLGVLIMAYGFYRLVSLDESMWYGLTVLAAGAAILLVFMWILIKEYNYVKN
jgi:hypothetical protein